MKIPRDLKPEWRRSPASPFIDVSESGIVRSWRKSSRNQNAVRAEPIILKPRKSEYGYYKVGFKSAGRYRSFYIHALVAEAWLGKRPEGMECRHLDGDKTNNHYTNLAWGTNAENHEDKKKHGTTQKGKPGKPQKLQASDIPVIRRMLDGSRSMASVGRDFGVTYQTIRAIGDGRIWKNA